MKGPQQQQEIFYHTPFTDKSGITTFNLTGEPVNASAAAAAAAFTPSIKTFSRALAVSFYQLAAYIEKIKK